MAQASKHGLSFTLCAGLTAWHHIYVRASATRAQQGAQGQGLDMHGVWHLEDDVAFLELLALPTLTSASVQPRRAPTRATHSRQTRTRLLQPRSTHHVGRGPCEHVVDDVVFDHESDLEDKRRAQGGLSKRWALSSERALTAEPAA